jgi:hypothetical protein
LRDEEFHDLYSSPNGVQLIKSGMGWVGHVACVFNKGSACRFLEGKSAENRAIEKSKLRWEGNIKMYL